MAWLAVAAGGAIGSVLRYGLGLLANQPAWPWGTWIVNVLGSFLIGFFMVIGKEQGSWSPQLYLLLTTGMLGGFTTFSTLSLEATTYILQGQWLRGLLYLVSSVALGLAAAWLGIWLARQMFAQG
ncbi:fluoride efflux transporter CrcB [Brevibacillus fulvus]|uniref:Fluoride-specific ion channel FluC n=1 Tax=Brevibacillus fulvus TaxID=1125967 RepID=A0A938XZM1_9BACL|nr:fluoride efflux transporter CrcB [Brevibacillus fulvus]MBM7590503.1 CrcB protein [Brevibacillus fulvus]